MNARIHSHNLSLSSPFADPLFRLYINAHRFDTHRQKSCFYYYWGLKSHMAIQSQRYPPDISGLSTVDGGSSAAVLQRQQQQMLQFQTRILQQQNQHQQQHHVSDTAPFGFEMGSVFDKQSLEIDQYIRSQVNNCSPTRRRFISFFYFKLFLCVKNRARD